jgi:hypothetical protein
MTNTQYKKFTAGLISAWFLFSLSASALNVFQPNLDRPPIALGLAAVTPILLFLCWYGASASFQRFVLSLSPRALTMAHTWRINGFIFLVLAAVGTLPAIFALPAGLGDMAIGATAPVIAKKIAACKHGRRFVPWQVLGMLDLVMAVGLGVTARLTTHAGPGMEPMAVLPLSLVPVFFVPLLFIFHIIGIAQARQVPAGQHSQLEKQLSSSAV